MLIQDMQIDQELAVTYYAVFDGHGGSKCAEFLKNHLHIELKKCMLDQIDGIKQADDINEAIESCIRRSFEDTDKKYKEQHADCANSCGATAVIVLVIGNKLVCANVGDARAILCRNGQAMDLSIDHKAVSPFFPSHTPTVSLRRTRAHQKIGRLHSIRSSIGPTSSDTRIRRLRLQEHRSLKRRG